MSAPAPFEILSCKQAAFLPAPLCRVIRLIFAFRNFPRFPSPEAREKRIVRKHPAATALSTLRRLFRPRRIQALRRPARSVTAVPVFSEYGGA